MLPTDLKEKFEFIHSAANSFLHNFGPEFTKTPEGHIETDIIGASFIAGTFILRATVKDLDKYSPGTIILSEVHNDQSEVLRFISGVALTFNVNLMTNLEERTKAKLKLGKNKDIIESHQPMISPLEMTRILEPKLKEVCKANNISTDYGSFVSVLTAGKLIGVGIQYGMIKLAIAKELLTYYVIAGSKTVPYPAIDR